MKTYQKKSVMDWILKDFIFFVLIYLYFWLLVEPKLFYLGAGEIRYFPIFNKGWYFFKTQLVNPGGLADYISAFLAQFFYFSWTGALVLTLQAWLLCVLTAGLLKSFKANALKWTRFVPALLLIIFYSQYSFYFQPTVVFTIALFFTWLYTKLSSGNILISLLTFLFMAAIVYPILGGTFMLFAFLCAVYESIQNRKWLLSLGYMIVMGITPWLIGGLIYKIRVENAYWSLTPLSWIFQVYVKKNDIFFLYGFFLWLPVVTVLILIWQTWLQKIIYPKVAGKLVCPLAVAKQWVRWIAGTCVLYLALILTAFLSFNKIDKSFFEVEYYSYTQNWQKVIEAAEKSPNHFLIQAALNRALFHAGLLGEAKETLQQDPSTLLLTGKDHKNILWYQQDIFLDLGYINGAEHGVVECLEYYGEQPYLLKKLALINMVKGNIGTAQIYLNALCKTLFHKNWAEMYLIKIEEDPALTSDEQIRYLRSMMMQQDHIINYQSISGLLLELLNQNSDNRMAFEYLMTCYLLTRDIPGFTAHLDSFNRFYEKQIPRFYQEAVLIIANDADAKQYLQGKRLFISTQAMAEFKAFMKALNTFKMGKRTSLNEFPDEFKNSYYFYYTFFNFIHPGN